MRALRPGEEVLGRDGRRLGLVERLVVDEQAHRVTHVVVDGRLVGAGRLSDVDGARLKADLDRDDLRRQPQARPGLVSSPGAHWRAPGGYSIDDFLRIASALIGQGPYVPPVHLDLDLSAVHEIAPGSPVWSGQRHVGDVVEVRTGETDAVTSLVVRRPGLVGHRVLLPSSHVREVIGNDVHIDLTPEEVDALPPLQ